jgi:hypothetical protein
MRTAAQSSLPTADVRKAAVGIHTIGLGESQTGEPQYLGSSEAVTSRSFPQLQRRRRRTELMTSIAVCHKLQDTPPLGGRLKPPIGPAGCTPEELRHRSGEGNDK